MDILPFCLKIAILIAIQSTPTRSQRRTTFFRRLLGPCNLFYFSLIPCLPYVYIPRPIPATPPFTSSHLSLRYRGTNSHRRFFPTFPLMLPRRKKQQQRRCEYKQRGSNLRQPFRVTSLPFCPSKRISGVYIYIPQSGHTQRHHKTRHTFPTFLLLTTLFFRFRRRQTTSLHHMLLISDITSFAFSLRTSRTSRS